MIIVLSGAPGAGKGTQADLLAERGNFKKVSTGDALRNQIKLNSSIGREAEGFMKEGKLVPDAVLFKILTAELEANKNRTVLLDGYPRNLSQAHTLEELAKVYPVKGCVHLDVERAELIVRLSGRRVCAGCGASYHVRFNPPKADGLCTKCGGKIVQRPDDAEAKVAVRLEVYEKETKPVLDYYRELNLYHRIEGEGESEKIYNDLKGLIERLTKA